MTVTQVAAIEFLSKIIARTRSRKAPPDDEREAIIKLLTECSARDLVDFERRLFEEPDFKTQKLPPISLATFKKYHRDAGRTRFTAGEDPVPGMVQAYGHAFLALNAAPTERVCETCRDFWLWMGGALEDPELSHYHVLGIVGGPHRWPELVEKHGESAWVAATAYARANDPAGNPAPHGAEWHPLLRLYRTVADWRERSRAYTAEGPGKERMAEFRKRFPQYFPQADPRESCADVF